MASQPLMGEIRMFGGSFAPRGWAMCNGQTLAIAQNAALFALIGTTYGGDGVTTFQLPDLRSRVPIHQGQGTGLSPYVMGQLAGSESVTLTTGQIPQHNHPARAAAIGNTDNPVNNFPAADPGGNVAQFKKGAATDTMNAGAISPGGGSQPHENMQPFLVVTYIINIEGIFPARN